MIDFKDINIAKTTLLSNYILLPLVIFIIILFARGVTIYEHYVQL